MSATCPSGHASVSTDYCDTCGLPIGAGPAGGPPTPAPPGAPAGPPAGPPTGSGGPAGGPPQPGPRPPGAAALPGAAAPAQVCPSCSEQNLGEALFCESCGYDFTTGTMPRPVESGDPGSIAPPTPPAPQTGTAEWVVERWVDPDWYAVQDSDDPCPSPGPPVVVPLTENSVLIGRPSKSRSISPQVDCADDSGVSRRQAQLSTDGQRWWVEDLQSSNGTFVGPASGPLPTDPVPPGQRRELNGDERIYVGTWTRLVVRRATPEERG